LRIDARLGGLRCYLIDNFLVTTLQKYQIFQAGRYTFILGADKLKRKGKKGGGDRTGRKETKTFSLL
jgi:hypothetical protein